MDDDRSTASDQAFRIITAVASDDPQLVRGTVNDIIDELATQGGESLGLLLIQTGTVAGWGFRLAAEHAGLPPSVLLEQAALAFQQPNHGARP